MASPHGCWVVTAEPTVWLLWFFSSACVSGPGKEGGLVERFHARAPGGPCVTLSKTCSGKCPSPAPRSMWQLVLCQKRLSSESWERRDARYLSSINK